MLDPEHDETHWTHDCWSNDPRWFRWMCYRTEGAGLVDFVISTGANLYHDLHYALNFTYTEGLLFSRCRVV
ncbi:MAG: hypothetical protein Ct9H300mP25_15230 [Acidobacteriota bacterium]|nr:MAG: hypothetical protein Ct9H300mP25_15230 [Acidobacteriota bacterium]